MSELPHIPGIDHHCVVPDLDGWFCYSDDVDVPDGEEPHDWVEPEYYSTRDILRLADCEIDDSRSGCDHDSIWIYFRPVPRQGTGDV